jgi:predicted dienelactone hydrolase
MQSGRVTFVSLRMEIPRLFTLARLGVLWMVLLVIGAQICVGRASDPPVGAASSRRTDPVALLADGLASRKPGVGSEIPTPGPEAPARDDVPAGKAHQLPAVSLDLPATVPATYGATPGPHKVEILLRAWVDRARAREVPFKAYLPGDAKGARPLVVVSHGGGGSRDALSFLANHLASHGYVVVVAQHAGSDLVALRTQGRGPRAMRQALQAMVDDERNWSDRPGDISFLIDRVLEGGLGPRVTIDRERIAVAGHSFGAYTAMAIGGLLVDLKDAPDTSFRDPRVRAVIALSPQGEGQFGISDGAWARIDVPVMMMTGTKDSGLKGGEDWSWRRQAFDAMKPRADAGPYYLAIIEGAGHMAFADETNVLLDGIMGGRDPHFHGWIRQMCLAFLDAHLRDENSPLAWLHARSIQAESNRRVAIELGGKVAGPTVPRAEPAGAPRPPSPRR